MKSGQKLWFVVFSTLVVAAAVLYVVIFHPTLTNWPALAAGAVMLFIAMWIAAQLTQALKNNQSGAPLNIIFLVTVLGFFVYGVANRGGRETPDFTQIAAVLILFLLSEFAYVLTERLVHAVGRMEELKREMVGLKDDTAGLHVRLQGVSDEIKKQNLSEAAKQLTGASRVFNELFQLTESSLWEHIWTNVTEGYTATWKDSAVKILESRKVTALPGTADFAKQDAERRALLRCWKILLENYIAEERKDILPTPENSESDCQVLGEHIELATNQSFYLGLIERIAAAAGEEQGVFREADRTVVLQGITNLLPEGWFNWGACPEDSGPPAALAKAGERFLPIEDYRNKVTELVRRGRATGARIEYRRILLVDGANDILRASGIRRSEDLVNQKDLLLIKTSKVQETLRGGSDRWIAWNKEVATRLKQQAVLTACCTWQRINTEAKDGCYIILPFADFARLEIEVVGKADPGTLAIEDFTQEVEIRLPQVFTGKEQVTFCAQRLISKFIDDMHSAPDQALCARTKYDSIRDHLDARLLEKYHDILMVGYREKNAQHWDVSWQFALVSDLNPTVQTTLLRVMYDSERLRQLDGAFRRADQGGSGLIEVDKLTSILGL
jgi:hypothetical protein